MKVDHQLWAVMACDFRYIGGRNDKTLPVEGPLLFPPCQNDEPCSRIVGQGRVSDVDLGLVSRRRYRRRLDLQACEITSHVISSQHLDHLEVRERTEEIQAGALGEPADDLGLP